MDNLILPPSFYGLSPHEKHALQNLPWKTGRLHDVIGKEYSFYILSGRIKNEHSVIGPYEQLLGVIPFCENKKEKYQEIETCEILYLPAGDLAKFFLRYPKAMQSFIFMMENKGRVILNRWKDSIRIWNFVSNKATWQTLHAAYFLQTEAKQSCLFLEFEVSGMSIFSFLEIDPPPALLQSEDEKNLAEVLQKRIVNHHGISILNVQHLSYWKITRAQWASLLWELKNRYKHIIVHSGQSDFLPEECDGIFIFHGDRPGDQPPHSGFYPLIRDIYTGKTDLNNGSINYPLIHATEVHINKLEKEDKLGKDYWLWFENNISRILLCKDASILSGDTIETPEEFSAMINGLPFWENELFNGNSLIIAMGPVSIPAYMHGMGKRKSVYNIKYKDTFSLFKNLKPIFPENGFYTYSSFQKKWPKSFYNETMGQNPIIFAGFDYKNNIPCLLSYGNVPLNMVLASFPPGFIDFQEYETGDIHCMQKKQKMNLLAYLFRIGFTKINFYDFKNKPVSDGENFARHLLNAYSGLTGEYLPVSGIFSSQHTIGGAPKN